MRDVVLRGLLNEIQHGIQIIEGFGEEKGLRYFIEREQRENARNIEALQNKGIKKGVQIELLRTLFKLIYALANRRLEVCKTLIAVKASFSVSPINGLVMTHLFLMSLGKSYNDLSSSIIT